MKQEAAAIQQHETKKETISVSKQPPSPLYSPFPTHPPRDHPRPGGPPPGVLPPPVLGVVHEPRHRLRVRLRRQEEAQGADAVVHHLAGGRRRSRGWLRGLGLENLREIEMKSS